MYKRQAYAQTTVKGKITSEDGEPLIGATVAVKNSTDGTVTDIDGNYSLKTKKILTQKDLLVFSYVGYKTLQKNYAGNTMNVKLAEESQQLNDVVVTALGIKREEKGLFIEKNARMLVRINTANEELENIAMIEMCIRDRSYAMLVGYFDG